MTMVDIFIIIFITIFALIGLKKGLIKIIFSFSKKLIAFIAAYFLTKPFTKLLIPSKLGVSINNSILEWICEKWPEIASITDPSAADIEIISESSHMPKFIIDMLLKLIDSDSIETTFGNLIADTITHYTVTVIAYFLLVIILLIVVSLLSNVLNSLFETVVLKPINRILGMLINITISLLFVSLALLALNALAPTVGFIDDFVQAYIDPSNSDFGVARFLYNNNILVWLMDNLISLEDIFGK